MKVRDPSHNENAMKNFHQKYRFVIMPFILGICLLAIGSSVYGLEQAQEQTSSTKTFVFYLKPIKELGSITVYPAISQMGVDFLKEPDLGTGKIVRNVLPLGRDSKDYVPFAWNPIAAKLYVDFNRNLDLTDDPNNVFSAADKRLFQVFRNIPIEIKIDDLPFLYSLDINLQDTPHLYCFIQVNNAWQGEVDLPHCRLLMTVSDNMNGKIDLEPATDSYSFKLLKLKDESTSYPISSFSASEKFTPARLIFLQDQAYELEYAFEKHEEEIWLKTTFTEKAPDLGTLRLSGQYIKQLILTGYYNVFLYSPGRESRIPCGNYPVGRITIQKPPSGVEISSSGFNFYLVQGRTCVLDAGGPLRNLVFLMRIGNALNMQYHILGIGNEEYPQAILDPKNPPGFEVYKAENKIGSGKMGFG